MKLKFLGVPVYIDGQNYYVPSLSFAELEENYDLLTTKPEGDGKELLAHFRSFFPVFALALKRNYPDIDEQWFASRVDMNTINLLVKAVQGASGLTAVNVDDEGEDRPVA